MRKLALIFALAAVVALALPAVAQANFAIHGNYVADDDACAGCHRAHTSVSSITWTQSGGPGVQRSALLVSSATTMEEFCYACHDGTSQGADTNVEDGVYEGSLYGSQDATLNGGGFSYLGGGATPAPVTSTHLSDGSSWGAYGGGFYNTGALDPTTDGSAATDPTNGLPRLKGESTKVFMDCATCHDPHGSPNYRLLKMKVNGNTVGQYDPNIVDPTDPTPNGFVSSVETGWPVNGFRLHTDYPGYVPNYTEPMYAKGYDMISGAVNPSKGMSGWCVGCHSTYMLPATVQTKADGITTYVASASMYDAGDGFGYQRRHKHPINVPLSNYQGPDAANMNVAALPVAHDLGEQGAPANAASDWIECLTCHRAHGTAAVMTGWANELADLPGDEVPSFIAEDGGGVPSALLRHDNRGVCERCHNK